MSEIESLVCEFESFKTKSFGNLKKYISEEIIIFEI